MGLRLEPHVHLPIRGQDMSMSVSGCSPDASIFKCHTCRIAPIVRCVIFHLRGRVYAFWRPSKYYCVACAPPVCVSEYRGMR